MVEQPARRVSNERFHQAVRSVDVPARIAETSKQQLKEWAIGLLRRVPVARDWVDRPSTRPLRSGSIQMYRWLKAPYGTPEKPESLREIPWDYVEENQDEIPFLGLREYWYPAIKSGDLRNNEPKPVTMLGDHLVFFRDGNGKARALENRCPHRGAMLSLGQIGIFEPGTITCRYHGMTFDGDGECVAFLTDGPDSPMCGKVQARSYPVEEHAGMVFAYMGDKEPEPLLDFHPHARTVLAQKDMFLHSVEIPFSHLNMLDNATDLTHTGCLHRTCLLFASQKPFGEVGCEEIEGGRGLRAFYKDSIEQPGAFRIDQIEWFLPNHVYHAPDDLGGGLGEGWFWFVPKDVGSFTGWFLMGRNLPKNPIGRVLASKMVELMFGKVFGKVRFWPGNAMSCLEGGDVPMMASLGRVTRWDRERLARTDRSVTSARRIVKAAHAKEVAERAERAANGGPQPRRIKRPEPPEAHA